MSNRRAVESVPLDASIRIDKLLWFLRFCRNRTMAKKLAEKGYVRLNGRRVDRAHLSVRTNDILTIPVGREVRVVRIVLLPERRGSAPDALSCYEILKTGY
ncbi:MAG: S4 domain-containing protein [Parasphingorhabdus sp.]